jgi:hypothetical protein
MLLLGVPNVSREKEVMYIPVLLLWAEMAFSFEHHLLLQKS